MPVMLAFGSPQRRPVLYVRNLFPTEMTAARSGLEDYITSLEVTARKPVSSAKQNDNRAAQKPGGRERA